MNEELLYKVVHEKLIQEDGELTDLSGQGIFYAPELYIAFILGKEIKKKELDIFGQPVEWIRERNFKNGGPTDFAFKLSEKTFVFELKIRNTHDSYASDIEKLKKLDSNYEKYFIALVDVSEKEISQGGRIVELEKKYNDLLRVSTFQSFPTVQNWYKDECCCALGFWKLNNSRLENAPG